MGAINISKKAFKEMCRSEVYTGYNGHQIKINAIFFDWKDGYDNNGKRFVGYKYMVSADVHNISKIKLLDVLYDWIINNEIFEPLYFVDYKFAETDLQRFKIPLSI